MPNKLNYDYVKKYIEEKSLGECELISKEYVNNTSKLKLRCSCGNIFENSFAKIRNSTFKCKQCILNKASETYRLKIEDVIKYIEDNECEYISGEYKNNTSLLTLKCKCGNIFEKNFRHFKRGQNRCPNCGKKALANAKKRYTKEMVLKTLNERGITLLSEYTDSYKNIECICSKGHKFKTKYQYILYNNFGCLECSKNYYIGENANHYKGGESEVVDDLRKCIKQWKFDVLKKYNFKCYFTDTKKDLVVHHLKSFMTIVQESCAELSLPLYRKFSEYQGDEFQKLKKLVIDKHTIDIGIVLERKIHKKFHTLYGIYNNTKEQFNDFIEKHYPKHKKIIF